MFNARAFRLFGWISLVIFVVSSFGLLLAGFRNDKGPLVVTIGSIATVSAIVFLLGRWMLATGTGKLAVTLRRASPFDYLLA